MTQKKGCRLTAYSGPLIGSSGNLPMHCRLVVYSLVRLALSCHRASGLRCKALQHGTHSSVAPAKAAGWQSTAGQAATLPLQASRSSAPILWVWFGPEDTSNLQSLRQHSSLFQVAATMLGCPTCATFITRFLKGTCGFDWRSQARSLCKLLKLLKPFKKAQKKCETAGKNAKLLRIEQLGLRNSACATPVARLRNSATTTQTSI